MATGEAERDVIREGVLVVRGGLIEQVGTERDVDIPTDATIIDAAGGQLLAHHARV